MSMYISQTYIYKGSHLEQYFTELPKLDLEILKIQWNKETCKDDEENKTTITAQQQFLNYYDDRMLAFDDMNKAKTRFFMIWEDNRFLIKQISNQEKILNELCNLTIWSDNEKSSYYTQQDNLNYGTTTSLDTRRGIDKTNNKNVITEVLDTSNKTNNYGVNATSTQNSNIDEDQLLFLDDENRTTIKHNLINQTGQKTDLTNKNTTKTDNLVVNDGDNKHYGIIRNRNNNVNSLKSLVYSDKGFSNDAKDRIEFLNLNIRELREVFWSKFNRLFIR